MGKAISDENLVTVARQTLKEYRQKLQLDPSGNVIPQEVRAKVIQLLENQILKPVGEGSTHTMLSLIHI